MGTEQAAAEIRYAKFADLDSIAECHMSAFPLSLSTAMGRAYVRKMLEWYAVSPKTFIFFIKGSNACLGYCGGMVRDQQGEGSASSMAQYTFSHAILAFLARPWLLFHPEVVMKYGFILKNLVNGLMRRSKTTLLLKRFDPFVGLVVVGVGPMFQRMGYGSRLIKEFERKARELGHTQVQLSVRSDNGLAIKSYLRNGWLVKSVRGNSTVLNKDLR